MRLRRNRSGEVLDLTAVEQGVAAGADAPGVGVAAPEATAEYPSGGAVAVATRTAPGTRLALAPEGPPSEDRPRRRARLRPEDLIEGGLAMIAGGALAWGVRVVFDQHGVLGTALWWYAAALAAFYLLTRDRTGAEAALDRLVTLVVWSTGLLVTAILGWMITFLVI